MTSTGTTSGQVPGPRSGTPVSGRQWGRRARAHPLTARLLSELQVWRLTRGATNPELVACRTLAVPGTLAVDVGASVGNFTWALAKAVGREGRVLALEASPNVFAELVRSTWSSRVTALNLAASDRPGLARLGIPVDERGTGHEQLATLEQREGVALRTVEVRRVRLDDLVGVEQPVSLLKVDVEGHEAQVLAGAVELLRRHRPALVVEIEERHLRHRTVGDVVDQVTAHGYVCHPLRGRELLGWSAFDVHADQRRWLAAAAGGPASVITQPDRYVNNFVFLPREDAPTAAARLRHALGTP